MQRLKSGIEGCPHAHPIRQQEGKTCFLGTFVGLERGTDTLQFEEAFFETLQSLDGQKTIKLYVQNGP